MTMAMRLSAVRIPASDVVESAEFYTILLDAAPDAGSEEDGFFLWQLENADLLVETEEPGEFEAGRFLGLSMEVPDIQSFYETAQEKQIEFAGPPEQQEWGGILLHAEDPDGNFFSVVQTP